MPADSRPDLASALAVIIVHYRCPAALRQCLASLPPCRVVVVDNSGDCGLPGAIINTDNRGFAAACNQGIRATTEPFVLLLNPDTVVSRAALERLLATMTGGDARRWAERPREAGQDTRLAGTPAPPPAGGSHECPPMTKGIGACGPLVRNDDGSVQTSARRFPTLWRMALAEFGLRRWYYVSQPGQDAEQLMGSCLLLRREALEEVGLLDERFFVYFEEVDLCLRLKQAGWRVVFVPDAEITHIGSQSSQFDRTASLRYRYRSLFAFYRKHYPRWHLPVLKLAVQMAALLRFQSPYRTVAREVWSL